MTEVSDELSWAFITLMEWTTSKQGMIISELGQTDMQRVCFPSISLAHGTLEN